MTPERWKQVEEIFQSALDHTQEKRQAFIAQACAGDAPLREQVEMLVGQYEAAGSFLEVPALGDRTVATTDETVIYAGTSMIGKRIGAYKITREIGRGGMGAVYLAVRADSEFQKRVAIKLIKRGMDTDFIIRRFRNERQILASLDHPNVARLLDGGTTEDSLPYFVMEYVEGQPIHYYCDTQKLSIVERLELFRKVCSAVHYAHQNLIIHRDLKPSNILVTADGTPKLLDFGIAKILNPEMVSQSLDPTTAALRLMTPEYASPEQVRGESATVSSDVYSLGVLLYELLTDHRPYRLRSRMPAELARVICEEEPERPSVAINLIEVIPTDEAEPIEITPETVSRARGGLPEQIRRQLAGSLDNIVLKALRKEPHRRYTSVEQFSEDIRRYLEGLPVSATPYFAPSHKGEVDRQEPTTTGGRSIAILPFKMLRVEEKSDEYLGMGMADAIITKLSNIQRIIVRPTSAVIKYADGESNAVSAGHELDVNFVLDGRIQRVADRVRVTVQLVRVRDGAPLWATKFDENFTDIFEVEDSISGQVAEALMPRLTGEERELLYKRETENAKAYQAYLKGRYFWNKFTDEDLGKALEQFEEAIRLDPNYALAYVGVADYHNWAAIYGVCSPEECFPQAKAAASRALEIDDSLAEAHAALAFTTVCYDWDWVASEQRFKRALELNPNYGLTHQWYSNLLAARGRFDEAITEMKRAQQINPLSVIDQTMTGWTYYHARQYEMAIEELQKALQMDRNFGNAHMILGAVYAEVGMYDEAISMVNRSLELMEGSAVPMWVLGYTLAASGRRQKAQEVLGKLERLSGERYISPYQFAVINVGLGNYDAAFEWLEKAYESRDEWLLWLGTEPKLDALRSDPRFTSLLRRVGLAETTQTQQARDTKAEGRRDTASEQPQTVAGPLEERRWWQLSRTGMLAASIVALALVAVVGLYFYYSSRRPTRSSIVTRLTNNPAADLQPRWSPGGRRVAFVSGRDGKQEIYTMDAEGGDIQRLTFNSVDDLTPGWSPDGRKIAFTSKRDGNDEIYVMNADGGNQENLSRNGAVDSRPSFSPDGKRIVFASNRGNAAANFDIYVMGADGSNPFRLTDDQAVDTDPVWSPDGRKIAFTSNRSGNFGVYTMNADGSLQTEVSRNPSFNGKPAWSPDGRLIAFTSNRSDSLSNPDIYVMDADGGNQRRLTTHAAADDEPSWSPDGKELAFQSERDGNSEIYVIAPTGEGHAAPQQQAQVQGIRSIAVLPFKTQGADGNNQYLGMGLADLLTMKLSQIKQIAVRPPSAVQRYSGAEIDPQQAGRELGVDCVLDGQIQQNGDRVMVVTRLISVRDGRVLWAEKFDQTSTDMQSVQDKISDRVARAMLLELTSDERRQLEKRYTENSEAYQLYLIGRYHSGKRTPEGLRQAIEYFGQAIGKDQKYALAYAGLADAYGLLGLYDPLTTKDSLSKSKEAALKALAIDDSLAEAHNSLAFVKLYYERDLRGAEDEFKTAIELKPNYPTAHHWYALALSAMGQHDRAISEISRAQELDPLSLIISTAVGNIYYYAGLHDRAIEQCLKTIEMDQRFVPAHTILRQAYEKKGMAAEAAAEYQKEKALAGDSPGMLARMGHVYASTGRRAEAEKIINQLLAIRQRQFVSAYEIAQLYALLEDEDRTVEWLAKSAGERAIGLAFVNVDPDFNNLRNNPRFKSFLQSISQTP
ncbi:MAG TPA: protein kinase [Pyrinomonadaceae bacterium]|jgi:Tol biopolymer transport system component/TolB-like protein/Tfp pilus assembly protein PilF/tRNA A-37 threonylcarbamoyl transferase component Bud32